MARHDKTWMDCDCNKCFTHRVTYALLVASNQKDIKKRDMERALTILTHGIWLEDIGARDVT